MEVLISTFVLSIGLMSLAALIPVGRYTIAEVSKSDYAAHCGRAAMRDIKIQRMLDYSKWAWPSSPAATLPNLQPFVLDPIGRLKNTSNPNTLGPLPRVSLNYTGNLDWANRYFEWNDDAAFDIPADASLRPMVSTITSTTRACMWMATRRTLRQPVCTTAPETTACIRGSPPWCPPAPRPKRPCR